ncbi:MAG: MFS transporter [Alphaproteobacteria bacterium]|nr:MFS transporter [Alphaproteobacteria bacterium]
MTIDLAMRMGAAWAGILILVMLGAGAIANLWGGGLCDRIDPVSILRRGEIAHAASLIAMLVFCHSLTALIALYFLKNLFFSISLPAGELVVMRGSPPDQRKRIYALNNVLNNVAIPSGALVGALLYGMGLRPLLAAAALLSIGVYSIYRTCMQPDPARAKNPRSGQVHSTAWTALMRNRTASYLLAATVLLLVLEFSFGQYFAVKVAKARAWPFWGGRLIEGPQVFGILRAELAVVSVTAAFLCVRWVERLQSPWRLAGTMVLATGSFLALLHAKGTEAMMLCVALMGIVDAIATPILQTLFVNSLSSRHCGLHLSIYSLSGRFANMSAAVVLAASGVLSPAVVSMLLGMAGILASGFAFAGCRRAHQAS